MSTQRRVRIRGNGWTKITSIDAGKFDAISKALLASLANEPVAFTTLVQRVATRLPDFEGSIAWYVLSCARELEVRGELVRQGKPTRYRRSPKLRNR